jgi:hypothetical protein
MIYVNLYICKYMYIRIYIYVHELSEFNHMHVHLIQRINTFSNAAQRIHIFLFAYIDVSHQHTNTLVCRYFTNLSKLFRSSFLIFQMFIGMPF